MQVVVTDGFTGNVMLKTAEGIFKFITTYLKQQYAQGGVLEKLGGLLSKPVFARMKAEIGRPAKVIATGGLATLFEQHTDVFDVIEPDLTIQGLAIMYQNAHIG